ncbi:MAG: ABC transporter permease [Cytophagaceae bacterium]|nr:ABC transporter permease [Cytophagaceae bacterium]
MIKNYFKIAWRNLKKNGVYSFLNLLGLAVGVSIFLFLTLFINQELSFDKYNKNYQNIVRIGQTASFDGQQYEWATVPNIVGPTMTKELPEIKSFARILGHSFGKTAFVNTDTDKFSENKLFWTDGELLNIFDINLIEGNPKTALDAPNKIILSKSKAEKYFGQTKPIGKTLKIDNDYTVTVTGVFEDLPNNSTLDAEMLGSFSTIQWASKELHWSNASYETYFLLNQAIDLASLTKKINAVLDKNIPKDQQWFKFWLQPLQDIHLYSTHISISSTTQSGDANQVKILIALALAILIIACVNYMNLATAQSQKNQKEVGLSKVMGASRWSLIKRFYAESFLMVLFSTVVGLIILVLALPFFNNLADTQVSITELLQWKVLATLAFSTLVLAVMAGSYPALLISSFSPLSLFGRKENHLVSAQGIRKGLVVLQFSASIVLIICTLVFYNQLHFMQNKNLGYEVKQIISVTTEAAESKEQIDGLMNELKSQSFVKSLARTQVLPAESGSLRAMTKPEAPESNFSVQTNHSSPEIFETLGLKLLAGKAFIPKTSPKDTMVQVVLNQSAIKFYGYTPEQAIGKTAYNLFGWNNAQIVGVVEDFHFEDFHKPIGAYGFHNQPSEGRPNLLIKVEGGDLSQNLATIQSVFQKNLPNSAFKYTFLSDAVAKLYAAEKKTSDIVLFFSVVAILIACLGLFGLAAYMAEQRTKEIGVRKVLGASISSIVGLLSFSFIKLVMLAFLLAAPLSWFYLNTWLNEFSYHINMPWWAFLVAGLFTLTVAIFTVSFQSIKASLLNPVKSLKSE